MPKLILFPGTPQAREFELQPGRNFIGRGFTNDFRIEDASVSVSHVQLMVNGNSVTVKDLGSTNGTYVNQTPIKEGYLQPGQVLQLGGIELLFAGDLPAAAVAAGTAPTMALPRPAAKYALPGAKVPAGGTPIASPVPAPVFTHAAVGFAPQAPQSQAPKPAPTVVMAPAAPMERLVPTIPSPDEAPLARCIGYGLSAIFMVVALWTGFAVWFRFAPAPYFCWAAGLICGFAVKGGSGNRVGVAYSLLATGFCLLAIFGGELGQVFAIQTVSFRNESLMGLFAGVFSAWWLGGGMILSSSARRARIGT